MYKPVDKSQQSFRDLHTGEKEGSGQPPSSGSSGDSRDPETEPENKGILTLDATCAPAHIRYPQDISLLNEAREFLEGMIWRLCKFYGLPLPRRYRRQARKAYLAFAKAKKHTAKKVRAAIRKQLGYDHKVYSVADRIVSISQPWLRPIVRGKVTAPVEFGAKFDLSLDTEGYRRTEKNILRSV